MSMGFCPTRASRSWEPRYYSATMTYTYLCDEDMLPNLQEQQTGHSSDSLRDFSQLIISQCTTLYKEKMYQSKAFDSTNEGWLILIVKLAISISFVGKLKRKACGSCFFGTPLVFSKTSKCMFISIHHVIKVTISDNDYKYDNGNDNDNDNN